MNKTFAYTVGFLILAALVLFSMTYTVRFNEVAVRTTFGKTSTASVKSEPGIHFRFPLFADRVTTYDTRVQIAQTPLVEVPTADGQSVVVRTFVMWKMDTDPEQVLKFASSYASERDADDALKSHLNTATKASLGRYSFDDLIGCEATECQLQVLEFSGCALQLLSEALCLAAAASEQNPQTDSGSHNTEVDR